MLGQKYIEPVSVKKIPSKALHDIVTQKSGNIIAKSSDTNVQANNDIEEESDKEVESSSRQVNLSPQDVKNL